jgi:hypothetical protein
MDYWKTDIQSFKAGFSHECALTRIKSGNAINICVGHLLRPDRLSFTHLGPHQRCTEATRLAGPGGDPRDLVSL